MLNEILIHYRLSSVCVCVFLATAPSCYILSARRCHTSHWSPRETTLTDAVATAAQTICESTQRRAHTHSHSVHTSQYFHEKAEQTCHSCTSETETKHSSSFCAQMIFCTASNGHIDCIPTPSLNEQQKHTPLTEELLFTRWALTLV